jgi:hypothetical protein
MELNLIVPVTNGVKEIGDEEIHGKLWRVTGPHNIKDLENLKFYCVSYVWGPGTEKEGSFFNCKREISDQTKPALAAAMKAAGVIQSEPDRPIVDAFWIDAICIPQLVSPERFKTLERYVNCNNYTAIMEAYFSWLLIAWDSFIALLYLLSLFFNSPYGRSSNQCRLKSHPAPFHTRKCNSSNKTIGSAEYGRIRNLSIAAMHSSQHWHLKLKGMRFKHRHFLAVLAFSVNGRELREKGKVHSSMSFII